MTDFIDRLNTERDELSDKLHKLERFTHSDVFRDMSFIDKQFLMLQHSAMTDYRNILFSRIASFKNAS